jgi:hypothetical protein
MRKSRTDKDKAMAGAVRAFAKAMLGDITTREAAEAVVKAIEGQADHQAKNALMR